MLTRIRKYLASTPYLKIGEHIALSFVGTFALAAVGTAEHAASTHGFSLSWSLIASAAAAGATAGYHKVRPLLLKTALAKLLGGAASATTATVPAVGTSSGGKAKVAITTNTTTTAPPKKK